MIHSSKRASQPGSSSSDTNNGANDRGSWGSKIGFILAAAGSAVGLGNVWRFPYVTGSNGGGAFVLVYLLCILLIGIPIIVAEILVGRTTQRSPVAAFRALSRRGGLWVLVGWIGVASGFVILSFYTVVSGWSVYYAFKAIFSGFSGMQAPAIDHLFDSLVADHRRNLGLHAVFMAACIGIVIAGVQSGIERWSRILMPALFLMLISLAVYGFFLPGWRQAFDFMFAFRFSQLTPSALLEAMGQAFFSLSLGMGAMITYGSYLSKETGVLGAAASVVALDTFVAILSSLVIFPVIFSFAMEPSSGPGLVFKSLPLAFSQMPGGRVVAICFFSLLVFAALTSAVSLLEVVSSTFIDLYGWSRKKSTLIVGAIAFGFGVPSALSGDGFFLTWFKSHLSLSYFELMDHLASNWMLPIGGLATAIFAGWFFAEERRDREFLVSTPSVFRLPWLYLVRFLAPIAVFIVLLNATGLLTKIQRLFF